jgi:hypothetical protein
VALRANSRADPHRRGSVALAKKSVNPSTVRSKPSIPNTKGKAKRAANVMPRFFQFVSRNSKAGLSGLLEFFRDVRSSSDAQKIPMRDAARKGIIPDPGSLRLPREASTEETRITTETIKKNKLLI